MKIFKIILLSLIILCCIHVSNPVYAEQQNKVLILHPFQLDPSVVINSILTLHLSKLKKLFNDNGYIVDDQNILKNKKANISGFLRINNPEYKIIYIATHISSQGIVTTGEKVKKNWQPTTPFGKKVYDIAQITRGFAGVGKISKLGIFQKYYIGLRPAWWERINLKGKIIFFANCNGLVKNELYNIFQKSNVSAVVGYNRDISIVWEADDILSFVLNPIFKNRKTMDLKMTVEKAEKKSPGLVIIKGDGVYL